MKKILSLLICLFIAAPAFAEAVSPSYMAKACENSGITGYYNSMSNAVFNMVNIVVENLTGINIIETAKKESPASRQEQKRENSAAAIIIANNFQKTLQVNFSIVPDFISAGGVYQALLEQIGTKILFQGWFLLLLSAILMCVRKKDANIAPISFKYRST